MSLTSDRISLKNIVAKVYRDLEMSEESDYINVIEWSVEALRFINSFNQYEKKTTCLHVTNYRAELPCDLVALLAIEYNGKQLDKASNNNINKTYGGSSITNPYSYNLSQMDSLPIKLGRLYSLGNIGSFTMKNGLIKTTFKEGNLDIIYNALSTDEEGIPLIPDDESYRAALTWYISMKYFFKKSISEERFKWFYKESEQKWNNYCRQAGAKAMMPDIFTLENIKRNFLSFIPDLKAYSNNFRDLNNNK